jgi:hypothetical protein
VLIECDEGVAVKQPEQPGVIDPGIGPVAVATDEVEWSPAERNCGGKMRSVKVQNGGVLRSWAAGFARLNPTGRLPMCRANAGSNSSMTQGFSLANG